MNERMAPDAWDRCAGQVQRGSKRGEEDTSQLCAEGRACTLEKNDAVWEKLEEGAHLHSIMCAGGEIMVDRWDARNLLDERQRSFEGAGESEREESAFDVDLTADEAAEANFERYCDLTGDKPERDAPEASPAPPPSPEDPPLAAADLPDDLRALLPGDPKKQKIMIQTARFVCEHGEQMEVVLKVKQAANPSFNFLFADDPTYPIFRQIVRSLAPAGPEPSTPLSLVSEDYEDAPELTREAVQLIMRKTASFIAKQGEQGQAFERMILTREGVGGKFAFLQPEHEMNEEYCRMLKSSSKAGACDAAEPAEPAVRPEVSPNDAKESRARLVALERGKSLTTSVVAADGAEHVKAGKGRAQNPQKREKMDERLTKARSFMQRKQDEKLGKLAHFQERAIVEASRERHKRQRKIADLHDLFS